MNCPNCSQDNRPQAYFCDGCGSSLGNPAPFSDPGRTLQAIIDVLPHPIYLKDTEGTYLFANQAMAEGHNLSVEDFRRLHTSQLPRHAPEEIAAMLAGDRAVIETGERVDLTEFQVNLPGGGTGWRHSVKVPFRDQDGKIVGVVGLVEDITQRVETEKKLQQLNARFLDAIQSLPSAFALYDKEERLVYWNQKTEEFFPSAKGRLTEGMKYADIVGFGHEGLEEPKPPREQWVAERLKFFREPPEYYEQELKGGRHTQVVQTRTSEGGLVRIHVDISGQKAIQARLLRANEALETDLHVASEFQASLLPPLPSVPFLQLAGRYLPAAKVSGDLYNFLSQVPGRLGFFIGDAAGHDITAAFLTMMVQIGLQSMGHKATPARVMQRLNALIAPMELRNRFISGLAFQLDETGLLTACNAGHPALVVLPSHGQSPVLLTQGGMALGMLRDPILPFSQETYQLAKGDRVVALTDGLFERGDGTGAQFGMKRLLETLTRDRHANLSDTLDAIIAAAEGFANGRPQEDDITLFAFRFEGV